MTVGTIGDRIKQRRIDLGLTAEDLAKRIGKSRATVYRYENGDIEDMPTTILEPLSEALHTSPAYLMGWDDNVISTPQSEKKYQLLKQALHDSEFALTTIYAVFGYKLYTLCNSYLSLSDEGQSQLLSFANFLNKTQNGNDFEMETEEEIINNFPIEKISKLIDDDFLNMSRKNNE